MASSVYVIQNRFFPIADTDFNIINFGFQDTDPNHRMKDIKPEHVIQYIIGGAGFLELDGKIYKVKSGDLFYLPKNVLVHYYADKNNPYRYYWMDIDGTSARSLLERAGITPQNPVIHYNDSRIADIFAKIEPYIREDTFTGYLMAKGYAFELMSKLLSYKKENALKLQSASVEYVNKAIQFVKNNFNDNIGVNDMAAYIGIGRSYLCVIFKKLVSLSPVEYLIHYRISQAEKMLSMGLTVTETAINCGFNSPAHFSVQFKKITGKSPTKYRSKK